MGTTRAGGIAIAVLAVGLALSGCGSDKKSEPAASKSSSSSSSAASSAPSTAAVGANETIADYIKKNNINEANVARGDEGAPTIDLPVPDGWEGNEATKPQGAYGQIVSTADPAPGSKRSTITALVSKLSDNADPAEILTYAPGEVKNLPGFEGGDGEKGQLSGLDSFKIGGTYVKDGAKQFVAQQTVVIPGPNGLFVLQLNAQGPESGTDALLAAMDTIDEKTTITP
jgi:hypothetical protein